MNPADETELEAMLARLRDAAEAAIAKALPMEPAFTVIGFAELQAGVADAPGVMGFVRSRLDEFAAMSRRDASLVGRPTIALGFGRITCSIPFVGGRIDWPTIEKLTRNYAVHEAAHTFLPIPPARPCESIEGYLADVAASFALKTREQAQRRFHDAAWWRLVCYLWARLGDDIATADIDAQAGWYGFGSATAEAWLDAVRADPLHRHRPARHITAGVNDRFDELLGSMPAASAA